MLLTLLGFVAVILTLVMFQSRNSMLGIPCALFWFLFGIQAYTLYVVLWDIYYCIFFASCLGMTLFSAFAAFGLREKPDKFEQETKKDGESEDSFSEDKEAEEESRGDVDDYGEPITRPSDRTVKLHERTKRRREAMTSRKSGQGSW